MYITALLSFNICKMDMTLRVLLHDLQNRSINIKIHEHALMKQSEDDKIT